MSIYGQLHSIADFLGSVVPRQGQGKYADLFVHTAVDTLKRIDLVQQNNMWFSANFYAADGLWALYKGQLAFFLLPAKRHLRLGILKNSQNTGSKDLIKSIRAITNLDSPFEDTVHTETWYQWRLDRRGLELFCDFLDALEKANASTRTAARSHPRFFSPEDRNAAYHDFVRSGSWCPGFDGKRHKLNLKAGVDRIEFDHIIPYSKGGASTIGNLSILCFQCNRAKGATI